MDFYERVEKAQKVKENKKRGIIHPNRKPGAEKNLFVEFSECINEIIQNDLERMIENNSFVYNTGFFRRKTDCRYETDVKICFRYGNANLIYSENIFGKDKEIIIFQDKLYDENYDRNCYYITTRYLSDTKYILFYIYKNLKKNFANIFMDASWDKYFMEIFVDGLRMTKSLIESTVDKVTTRVMRKVKNKDDGQVFEACFQITVEVNCDKNGNI